MNPRIKELFKRAGGKSSIHNLMSNPMQQREYHELWNERIEKFAELIVEETLKEVDERVYGRGENQWYYDDDKKWIRLYFGYGELNDAVKNK